jgi:hypothetical protein
MSTEYWGEKRKRMLSRWKWCYLEERRLLQWVWNSKLQLLGCEVKWLGGEDMKFENVTSDLVVQLERCDEHLKVWRWSHQPMLQFCFYKVHFVGTRGFYFWDFIPNRRTGKNTAVNFGASYVQNWEFDRCPFSLPQEWRRLWVIKESDTINGLWTSQLRNRSHQKWDGGFQIRHLRYRSYEKSLSKDQNSRSQNRIGVKKAQAHQINTKNKNKKNPSNKSHGSKIQTKLAPT